MDHPKIHSLFILVCISLVFFRCVREIIKGEHEVLPSTASGKKPMKRSQFLSLSLLVSFGFCRLSFGWLLPQLPFYWPFSLIHFLPDMHEGLVHVLKVLVMTEQKVVQGEENEERKKKGEKMRDQKKEGNPWTLILSSPSFPSSSFLSFCTKTCHLPMIKVSLEDLSFCVLLLQSVFFFSSSPLPSHSSPSSFLDSSRFFSLMFLSQEGDHLWRSIDRRFRWKLENQLQQQQLKSTGRES